MENRPKNIRRNLADVAKGAGCFLASIVTGGVETMFGRCTTGEEPLDVIHHTPITDRIYNSIPKNKYGKMGAVTAGVVFFGSGIIIVAYPLVNHIVDTWKNMYNF